MRFKELLRSRPSLSTALGIAFAVAAGILALGYVSSAARNASGGAPLKIPVAATDIPAGTFIESSLIASWEVPSRYVVPGAHRKSSDVEGCTTARFVGKGEPFTEGAVCGESGGGGLAANIPADMRAYTLSIHRPVAGEMLPGQRVDVLSTAGDPPATTTILRSRVLLSTGEYPGSEDGGAREARTITLLVTPQEAESLASAEFLGEVSVSLCPLKRAD